MSDDPTREIPGSSSFEERIFARFDALDARLNRFESRIESKVDALDARLNRLETKVDALDSRLVSVEMKIDALDGRLTTLEEKVDMRLRETRPIWEGVLARLTAVESELARMNRQFRSYVADIFQLRVRIEKLEEDADTQTA